MPRETDGSRFSRRKLLKRVGVASVGVGAFAGASAAKPKDNDLDMEDARREHQEAIAEYTTTDAVELTVQERATDLLVRLAQRGYIDSPSVSAFNTDEITTSRLLDESADVVVSSIVVDEDRSAQIRLRAENDDAIVELYVQPQFDNTFAMVEEKASNERTKFKASDGPSINTDHDCTTVTECEEVCPYNCAGEAGDCCGYYYERTYECCETPNGRDCDVINSDCTGCACCFCCC